MTECRDALRELRDATGPLLNRDPDSFHALYAALERANRVLAATGRVGGWYAVEHRDDGYWVRDKAGKRDGPFETWEAARAWAEEPVGEVS